MNPAYTNLESFLQTSPQSTGIAAPSAPMEEDILVANSDISADFGATRQVESMPSASTLSQTSCNVPYRRTPPEPSRVPIINCAAVPAPPEATIIGTSSDPTQDTIPMVNATLVQESVYYC